MPDPKFNLGESRPERKFVNRYDLIEVFTKAVEEFTPERPRTIYFWGEGGIGKTELRTKLSMIAGEMDPEPVWASLDLTPPNPADLESALFRLRSDLMQKSKVQFPSFDIAYTIYWQKVHPNISLKPESIRCMEEGTLILEIFTELAGLPIIGLVHKISKLVEMGKKAYGEWWTKRGMQELKDVPEWEPAKIEKYLPAFLAADIKAHLEKEKQKAIIFVDPLDALWEKEMQDEVRLRKDAWVRELISHIPQVLWVVCGRLELKWEDDDSDWANVLDPHRVDKLDPEFCHEFLEACDIKDSQVQDVIIEGSNGVPFYLDLAVDTYFLIREKEDRAPEAKDFAKTQSDVVNRFLSYIDLNACKTLEILSIPRFWDSEIFELLTGKFNTGYPSNAMPELCRFSFIRRDEQLDRYTMHDLMRDEMRKRLGDDTGKKVHEHIFGHYAGKLEEIDIRNITDEQKEALEEGIYNGRLTEDPEGFSNWFIVTAKPFMDAALWAFIEPFYIDTLEYFEKTIGKDHPTFAAILNVLAILCYEQCRYNDAEPFYKRAIEIYKKTLGKDHPELATALSNLAELYRVQGKYDDAETIWESAIEIYEKALGKDHPSLATTLNNFALLYEAQGRYGDAEPLYKRTIEIYKKTHGKDQPELATTLNNFALLCEAQGRYCEAESLYKRAIEIQEKTLGKDHPKLAATLNNLGSLYWQLGKYDDTEQLYKRAIEIEEKTLGKDHAGLATSLNNLAALYAAQSKYDDAETLYERAIQITEKTLGKNHPSLATTLNNLAELYRLQDKFDYAEPLYERTIQITEKTLGKDHPELASTLNNLAILYQQLGKYSNAETLYKRAIKICEKTLGEDHPELATTLYNLGSLYQQKCKYDDAETLYKKAIEITENAFGKEHPELAKILINLARLYKAQGKYEDAEPLLIRALEILPTALGEENPYVATVLADLAILYVEMGRDDEAEELMKRANEIRSKRSDFSP